MTKRQQTQYIVGIVVIILIVVAVYASRKKTNTQPNSVNNNGQNQASSSKPAESGVPTNNTESDTWTGVLKTSDNPAKGNLMLMADSGKTIYFKTSRDYSKLLGKQVAVSYKGTLSSFSLEDIVAK